MDTVTATFLIPDAIEQGLIIEQTKTIRETYERFQAYQAEIQASLCVLCVLCGLKKSSR